MRTRKTFLYPATGKLMERIPAGEPHAGEFRECDNHSERYICPKGRPITVAIEQGLLRQVINPKPDHARQRISKSINPSARGELDDKALHRLAIAQLKADVVKALDRYSASL
jgi:hypothetical protein